MIPKELRRDRSGLTRLERIHRADKALAEARIIAAVVAQDPIHGIEQFASKFASPTMTARASGEAYYRSLIFRAAWGYDHAGLGLLCTRVSELGSGPDADWHRFDRDNATTGI